MSKLPVPPLKIAIQGVRASFHDVAARRFFKEVVIEPVECSSFSLLCQRLKNKEADFALMAIENTIAGSILPNYSLLESFGFKILGEVYLRIEMCLLALPGQAISDIRLVQSHPMAILQCEKFLSGLSNIKMVEASDTAESALEIKAKCLKNHAAIASRLAGETYGLELLAENIETDRSNYTRFLVLSRAEDYQKPTGSNKASIRFEAEHMPGSLVKALDVFHQHAVNMTKIQSIPIIGKPYQYGFHVDLEWRENDNYLKALQEIKALTLNLIHFGDYPSAEKPTL